MLIIWLITCTSILTLRDSSEGNSVWESFTVNWILKDISWSKMGTNPSSIIWLKLCVIPSTGSFSSRVEKSNYVSDALEREDWLRVDFDGDYLSIIIIYVFYLWIYHNFLNFLVLGSGSEGYSSDDGSTLYGRLKAMGSKWLSAWMICINRILVMNQSDSYWFMRITWSSQKNRYLGIWMECSLGLEI